MLNKISFSNINNNFKSLNFKANINTRRLLEIAEKEADMFVRNGQPVIEKLKIDKLDKISRFKKRRGAGTYYIYRTCVRKSKRYDNEILAEKAARATTRNTGIKFSTYHCPVCEKWHICKEINKFINSWD